MKNFSSEIYEEAVGNLTFPDYENVSYVHEDYSGLTSKIFDAVNEVALQKLLEQKTIQMSRLTERLQKSSRHGQFV